VASAVPLPLLLRYAYDVPINPSPRLSGVPDWRETFDIDAKASVEAIPSGLPVSERRARVQWRSGPRFRSEFAIPKQHGVYEYVPT